MDESKSAAIDFEKLSSKKLSEVSAKDFLDALQGQSLLGAAGLIKKDKRVERLLEPERIPDIDVKSIIEIIRERKKWLEYEKFPGVESFQDPRDVYSETLVDQIARRVVDRLETRGGGMRQ